MINMSNKLSIISQFTQIETKQFSDRLIVILLNIMRLFVHLINFPQDRLASLQRLKILKKRQDQMNDNIIVIQINTISTTDHLIDNLCNQFLVTEAEVIIKLVVVGKYEEKKVRMVRGFDMRTYIHILGEEQAETSLYNFQIQLYIESIAKQTNISKVLPCILPQLQNSNRNYPSGDLPDFVSQIYKCSNQLFEYLHNDNYEGFKTHIQILKGNTNKLRNVLNLYNLGNGYTLLLISIYYNKTQFLSKMLNDYRLFINMNYKSADGWLPFQLALAISNKMAINIMISFKNNGLNLNFISSKGRILFNLIDTINIELIQRTIKKIPFQFQEIDPHTKQNGYQYIWKHNRFVESQKQQILQLMHQQHFRNYDFYRHDIILYCTCKEYLPQIPQYYAIKKAGLTDLTLKILTGEIFIFRTPLLHQQFIFLSVNSYTGLLQIYEINSKLNLTVAKQKLQRYQNTGQFFIQQIDFVGMLTQQQKPWYMKQKWFCFEIRDKKGYRLFFACTHESAANQWVEQIKQAIKAWNKNEYKNQQQNKQKNYITINDLQIKTGLLRKQSGKGIIEFYSTKARLQVDTNSIQDIQNMSVGEMSPQMKKVSIGKMSPQIQNISAGEMSPQISNMSVGDMSPLLMKSKSANGVMDKMDLGQQGSGKLINLKYGDFKMLQLLGEGSFGQVFLAECLRNNQLYALKIFKKKKLILSKQAKFVIEQVGILKQIKHPFIVTLYFTFQTPNYIYLGLQYSQGKDLSKHLNQQKTIPESDVKIYAAEIVLALEHLHSIGIIYRDLKPENLMLGKDGHILLVDFGLSKKTQANVAKTFCGSPAYLSPEMLSTHEVGLESDFFSLGVVIFELLYGEPPFYSQNIQALYQNIKKGNLKLPSNVNPMTQSFLKGLLQKQPKKRLGASSIQQIKNHPFLAGINWQKLMKKQIAAPKRDLFLGPEESECEQQIMDVLHQDYDYNEENKRINRFRNFSFVRQEQFL